MLARNQRGDSPGSMPMSRFALVVVALAAAWPLPGRGDGPPPNVVLILADDLGLGHVGCYGQRKIATIERCG